MKVLLGLVIASLIAPVAAAVPVPSPTDGPCIENGELSLECGPDPPYVHLCLSLPYMHPRPPPIVCVKYGEP